VDPITSAANNGNRQPSGWKRPFLAAFARKLYQKLLTYSNMLRFFDKFFAQIRLKTGRLAFSQRGTDLSNNVNLHHLAPLYLPYPTYKGAQARWRQIIAMRLKPST
jgi:hypothetical protein